MALGCRRRSAARGDEAARPALFFRYGVVRSGGATRPRGQPAVMKRATGPVCGSSCSRALRPAVTRRFDIASRSATLDVWRASISDGFGAPRGPHESSGRADGCPRARPERSPPTDLPTSWSAEPTTIGRGTRNAAPRSAATGTRAQEHARRGAATSQQPSKAAPSKKPLAPRPASAAPSRRAAHSTPQRATSQQPSRRAAHSKKTQ